MKNIIISLILFTGFLIPKICLANTLSTATSPDEKIKVELFLRNDSLFYRVYFQNDLIVNPSNLGIAISTPRLTLDFSKDLSFESTETKSVSDPYTLPSGKKHFCENNYNELKTSFNFRTAYTLQVIFRIFNDGFAFRYDVSGGTGKANLSKESSEINISELECSWAQKYHHDYTWYYERRVWDFSDLGDTRKLNTPALVKKGNIYMLITEAENNGTYAASELIPNQTFGSFRFNPVGSVSADFPVKTPWRAVILGELTDMAESTMIENLNPATKAVDISWIKPGRASWDWGGEDARNSVGLDIAKRYIDLANRMGWEYFLLDDGWDRSNYQLSEVIDYANQKNVGVILWSHQNRFQDNRQDMYNKLKVWKDMGIKGLKIDFWDDDNQRTMQKYDYMMDVTSELQLILNLHGCTKPSGTRRTWPHYLTSEAVLGGEFYIQDDPHMTHAKHNINVALTRNIIGPMDYTPCDFARKTGIIQRTTSWGHQVAQTIAYESGIQCLLDCPENYRFHISEDFLKRIPVAWDDIKCLEAQPESYVTIARKKGDDWYVASLANDARTLNLDLSFLEQGRTYYAYIYKDGDCMSEIKFDFIPDLTSSNKLNIPIIQSGGVTVNLSSSPNLPKPVVRKYEAEDYAMPRTTVNDPDGLCSGKKYVTYLTGDRVLKFNDVTVENDGEYALTVYFSCTTEKKAYININGEESPMYHNFIATGGETGKYLAMKTIVVSLKKGKNTIEIGNQSDVAPGIDRITLKNISDEPGTSQPVIKKETVNAYMSNNNLIINTAFNGTYTIFDLWGRKITSNLLNRGDNICPMEHTGICIINICDGIESYSFKFNTKM